MPTYAMLIAPNANRVYGRSAPALTLAELGIIDSRVLGGRLHDLHEGRIAGIDYVMFSADDLGDDDVAAVSNLSSVHALFELRGEALHPIELHPLDRYDDDLITIPRYTGKTNEALTKLLVNVTWACAAVAHRSGAAAVRLLDPLCGRGSTLHQALMYGWDAAGVELDGRAVDAYEQFIKTWLQDKRIKHHSTAAKVRRDGKIVGRRLDITVSESKADAKAGMATKLTIVHDDTAHLVEHFPKRSFDLLVADLPYGVQHGSRDAGRLARGPAALLERALPAWTAVMTPGAAVGLAWNTRVLPRPDLAAMLGAAGLTVLEGPPFESFEHRVDRTIQRNVIIAIAPS